MSIGPIGSVSTNPALAIRSGALKPAAPPEDKALDHTRFSPELTEEAVRAATAVPALGPSPTRPTDNVDLLIQNLLGLHSEAPPEQKVPAVGEVARVTPPREVEKGPGLNYTRGADRVNVTAEAWQLANPR